jgi:hypothetical protein
MGEARNTPRGVPRLATFAVFVVSGKHQYKAHSVCAL